VRNATVTLILLAIMAAIIITCRVQQPQPQDIAIHAAAPACVFEKHPTRPAWRWA
jgi:hypothetical protein